MDRIEQVKNKQAPFKINMTYPTSEMLGRQILGKLETTEAWVVPIYPDTPLAEDIVRADQNRKIKDWLKKNPQYKLMKKTSRCGKWYENLLDSDWNILLSELSELKENK